MTPEGQVKDKVKKAFDRLPHRYRFCPVQNGMGAPGLDFYTCVHSNFVAIETKAPGKRLTARQLVTVSNIVAAGGVVFVIRDQDDIDFMMGCLLGVRCMEFGKIYDMLP
jgi:hypothetical protein